MMSMKLRWLPALVVATAASSAVGHDGDHPPVKVADAAAYKPSAIPDRIILTWNGDPARTQAVSWRTDDTVGKAIAEVAPASAAPKFVDGAKTVEAKSQGLTTDLGPARFHSVVFEGLTPSQLYAYRVGDGANWSEWFHFRTASDKPEAFSFIYFGDAQNDIKSLWSRVIRGAYGDAPRAKFIVHAGDLVDHGTSDAEWGEWFSGGGWVNGMVPSLPTPGNHEYERPRAVRDSEAKARAEAVMKLEQEAMANGRAVDPAKVAAANAVKAELSDHWRPQFALPENGPDGLKETVYYVDYQCTRIVSLNSNERKAEQVPWLESVLSNNPNRWTVVTFHHPVYSTAAGRDNKDVRDLWQPVFDKHKVDLVLQGHDHTYGRSGLRAYDNVATGTSARDNNGGTVYVVSVSGPKMYDLQKAEWMVRAAEDTQLYQVIKIDGDRLSFQAMTAVGDLYDAFDLVKRPGQVNELVDKAPKTPELRRAAPLGSQRPGVATATTATPKTATPARAAVAKTDLDAFQGTWIARTGPGNAWTVEMTIKGNKVRTLWPTEADTTLDIESDIKLDEKATPRRMQFTNLRQVGGGEIDDTLGIYAIEGDTIKLCFNSPGTDRPTEFKGGDADDRYPALLILRKK